MTFNAVTLSEDEVATVKALIEDWGWDYGLKAEREKIIALAKRMGLDETAKLLDV